MVIVPKLFPDDVASREAWDKKLAGDQGKVTLAKYRELRDKAGDPGRVSPGKCKVDPNRQFPQLGDDLQVARCQRRREAPEVPCTARPSTAVRSNIFLGEQHPTGREGHLACVASGVVANLIPDCVGPCRRSDSRATGASSTIRGV